MRRFRWLAGFAGTMVALAVGGCGAASGSSPASPARAAGATSSGLSTATATAKAPLQKVTLRLGWLVAGYDAPFILAKAKGWYRQAGYDVAIKEGKGAGTTVETVANGSDTFGYTDAATAAQLISKGAPVKLVADLVQTTPHGFIHAPDVRISSAADLKGKTLISVAGSGPLADLPAVLNKNHLTKQDVTIDLVSPSAEASTLKAHPQDVLLGVISSTYVAALKLMPDAVFTSFSKFGIHELSFGLITSNQELARDPNGVRRFIAASVKGWNYALVHQNQAVADTLRAFPQANKHSIALGLKYTAQLAKVRSASARGKPTGWMAASDWKRMLQLLHAYGGVKTVRPLADYYTNAFLPTSRQTAGG